MQARIILPEQSFIGQLDVRLKLPLLLGLVIMAFAALNWFALGLVVTGCLMLCWLSRVPGREFVLTWWTLRWLLLFSLLLHLFLTPGHTLFGLRWLSRDGLNQGLFVVIQISFALTIAMLLSRTTPVERLAAAFAWFMKPFRHFGCPVDEWRKQLLLVLKFLPLVRQEYLATAVDPTRGSFAHQWLNRTIRMLDRLLEQADAMATRVAVGEEQLADDADWPPLRPFSGANGALLLGGLLLLVVYLIAHK